MQFEDVIAGVLDGSVRPIEAPTEAAWHAEWLVRDLGAMELDAMAALGGALSDRLAWVFLSGYQATLARCFPDLPRLAGWAAFVNTEDRSGQLSGTSLTGEGDARRLSGWKGWLAASQHVERLIVSARQESLPFVVLPRDAEGVHIEHREAPSYLPELTQGRVQFADVAVPDAALAGDERTFPAFRVAEGAYIRVATAAFILAQSRRLGGDASLVGDGLGALLTAAGAVRVAMPSRESLVAAYATDRALQRVFPSFEALLRERDPELLGLWERDRRLVTGASERLAERAGEVLAGE